MNVSEIQSQYSIPGQLRWRYEVNSVERYHQNQIHRDIGRHDIYLTYTSPKHLENFSHRALIHFQTASDMDDADLHFIYCFRFSHGYENEIRDVLSQIADYYSPDNSNLTEILPGFYKINYFSGFEISELIKEKDQVEFGEGGRVIDV
jgi:hypothetical protein